jgi:hypothetical protein
MDGGADRLGADGRHVLIVTGDSLALMPRPARQLEAVHPLLGLHPGDRGHRPVGPLRLAVSCTQAGMLGPSRRVGRTGRGYPAVPVPHPDVADPRIAELAPRDRGFLLSSPLSHYRLELVGPGVALAVPAADGGLPEPRGEFADVGITHHPRRARYRLEGPAAICRSCASPRASDAVVHE